MTLERARALIATQPTFGGGYNRNSVRLTLAEIQPEHGQAGVEQLIRELDLENAFGLRPGTDFSRVTNKVYKAYFSTQGDKSE